MRPIDQLPERIEQDPLAWFHDMSIEEQEQNLVAEEGIKYRQAILDIVKDWPNEQILALAIRLERNDNCHGFRVESMDVAASWLRAETYYRDRLAEARTSKLDYYCFACHGECKGDEYHDTLEPHRTPEEQRIHEMHRDKLVKVLCELVAILNDPSPNAYPDLFHDKVIKLLRDSGIEQ